MTFSQSSSGNPCDWSVYASHVVLPADERHHPVSFHICHINMLFMGFIGQDCRILNACQESVLYSVYCPYPGFSDMCVSAASSSWPQSAPRSRSLWWWHCASFWASLFPSCTSVIPSQPGIGWGRLWCSWERCSTQKCGPAFVWQWKERKPTRRQSKLYRSCNTSLVLCECVLLSLFIDLLWMDESLKCVWANFMSCFWARCVCRSVRAFVCKLAQSLTCFRLFFAEIDTPFVPATIFTSHRSTSFRTCSEPSMYSFPQHLFIYFTIFNHTRFR